MINKTIAVLTLAATAALCSLNALGQRAVAGPGSRILRGVSGPSTRGRMRTRRFAARVQAALDQAHAQKAFWGILVIDAETGQILYQLNPDRFFTPASNTKLFTTAFALASLSPDYRFRTTIEAASAPTSGGALEGDLTLVGRGDPDFSNRKFPYAGKEEFEGPADAPLAEMADVVVARGVKLIDGDVVADDSYFAYDPYPAGWSFGDLYFGFGAPVSALALDDNTITVEVTPAVAAGEPAALAISPWGGYESFAHDITTGDRGAKPWFAVVSDPGAKPVLLRGSIPLGAAPVKLNLAMDDSTLYTANVLKLALEARGVKITGQARAQHGPPPQRGLPVDTAAQAIAPAAISPAPTTTPVVLAEHFSPPLIEIVRTLSKVSENLHAEMLLRTVAKEKSGIGTTDKGLEIEGDFLKSIGIADGDVALEDGSGLSGGNLVTPRAVTQILQFAAGQSWGQAYLSTLAIAGQDGTLEHRMQNTNAAGRIHAKTGSLEHVRAISGYAATLRAGNLIFSIFGNNDPDSGKDATTVLDAICVAMVEEIGPGGGKK
jgi:serine-type D-Ala-D-Ala carboxypeptidase/endopeptidase (penicillin-binding protein 4)